ncbi:MAG: replicative DNA helicase [Chitinispirillales bacterium]|jgi:replicative DNA helicase|nr:replicative DNA helicase [Chitinispirillales bacterium]
MQTIYKNRKQPQTPGTLPSEGAVRIPPQALDVERTILGSMLIDPQAADMALEHVDKDCFYSSAHSIIFECMRELSEKNIPIDIITVTESLRTKNKLEEVGAQGYLSELTECVATSGNIEHYAGIVKEKATLRQLISTAAEITTDCFSGENGANDVLDQAESKIFSISESRVKNKFESMRQLLPTVFKNIANTSKGGINGVPTGFTDLDQMTTGLQKGDLVIVAGRPSMGKTAFCLSVALHASVKAGYCTAIFSLEMSKDQIVQRMLCSEARVSMHALRSGTLPQRDYPKLSMAAGPLADAPLFVDDTPGITVLEMRAKARRLKAQYNLGLIIIDYLQLMGSSSKVESRQQEISQISRALKGIAKELDVPVIALSQLSRAVEQRTGDHQPKLSDLRESGAIEQDADVVMFVYREEVYNKDNPDIKGQADIIVGKQRNGPIGDVKVAFIKDYARFENLSQRVEEPHGWES